MACCIECGEWLCLNVFKVNISEQIEQTHESSFASSELLEEETLFQASLLSENSGQEHFGDNVL